MGTVLHKVIGLMSKEEQRNFKLFALRSHEEEDRKDLQLFDYMRKTEQGFQDRKAQRLLYGKDARPNTYHRLCNRLLQEIGKSIALLHWDKDETIAALHDLSLAMLYRKKQQHEIAAYYLKKAEKKIVQLDLPELLDVVLGEYIILSFELSSIDPEQYIQRRSENRKRLNQLWEIDNVLAMVNHRLRRTQNLGTADEDIMQILRNTVEEFSLDPHIMADPKFRFKMYDGVSKILLDQRDYAALETYLIETYDTFVQQGLFQRANHDIKLQMLTYIINTLFKNGKIDESLSYVERLNVAMDQFGQFLRNKYEFFYYNSLFLNYSSRDLAAGIKVLESMLANEAISSVPQHFIFICLNLAILEYGRRKYKSALKHLLKLQLSDALHAADESLRLRIEIFEFALRLDLKEYETLAYRIPQCKHDHADLLAASTIDKEAAMLHILESINNSHYIKPNAHLAEEIDAFLAKYPSSDSEFFKYDEFLHARR